MWPVPEVIETPSHVLCAMTFACPAASPPTVVPEDPAMSIPWWPFESGPVPAAFTPIRLPWTRFPEPPFRNATPDQPLPEITFPAPETDPPTVVFEALSSQIPSSLLPTAIIPVRSVPM